MSFSKAPVHRFNETINCAPPASKYTPTMNSKVKGLIPYSNQKGPRFQFIGSESCCSQDSRKNSYDSNYHSVQSRVPDSLVDNNEAFGDERISARPTCSRASISYMPRISSIPRKNTASNIDMASTNKSPQKRTASKGPLITDKQNKRGFEIQFLTKKKKLGVLKQELLEKQKSVLEIYSTLADIREKVLDATGKDLGPLEEIKLIDLGNMRDVLAQDDPPPTMKHQTEGVNELIELSSDFMEKLEEKLQAIPDCYVEFCTNVLKTRNTAFENLLNMNGSNAEGDETKLHEHLEKCVHEGDDLFKQLEDTKATQTQAITELLSDIRNVMTVQISTLENQTPSKHELSLQQKVDLLVVENTDLTQKLKACVEELEAERDKGNVLKDRKSSMDLQLIAARQKLRDMEQKLSSDEGKVTQLQSQMKVLEGQLKIRETAFENKTKELTKINKIANDQVTKLEKQRESLELRVLDLKKSLTTKEEEAVAAITGLQNKINEVTQRLEEEHNLKLQLESELSISEQRMLEVEEKGRQLAEMAEKTKTIVVSGEESKHSEREVELWNELQSTKVLLKSAQDQINALKEEKDKFLETINKASEDDENNLKEICTKYGAELVQKDDKIKQLQDRIIELLDTVAKCQEQNVLLDKQMKDYQERIEAQSGNSSINVQTQVQLSQLQQQVLDLEVTVSEAVHQNEQLEQALTQKQLEVEQRDRLMREQSKVLKVRDELIGLLKGKEQRQDEHINSLQSDLDEREKKADKVNKEIATKAEELQELYSTLENKQIQVMRLEKLVKQMEEQQERAQAQRTRHEARIAQLEHALMEKRNQRGSKFPFL
ncbi:putative leucine-rich repeat-containing protein DDB_G0290503 [Periplaneta americana]|uniref:putative leucine-rich repeat-containing protein DDB_G0290503 n=1 Tax=Periplaneta americana TaxID=6978 RepID=UPI0037E80B66